MAIHHVAQTQQLTAVAQRLYQAKADQGNEQVDAVVANVDRCTDGNVGIAPQCRCVADGRA